ncbi:MAG: glycoside hydrolase domain-containing protein, partial [Verrucomicrobiota bacterium]
SFTRFPYALPEAMQPFVRAGYDNDNLYLLLESPLPPGGVKSNPGVKPDDSAGIESQDCWELSFMQNGGKAVEVFTLKINPDGVLSDQRLPTTIRDFPAGLSRHKIGIEWSSGAKVATSRDDQKWWVEMAIPWKNLKLDSSPGTAFRVMIARSRTHGSQDNSAAEWNGAKFQFISDQPGIFVLAGQQPALRIKSLGDLNSAECRPRFALTNPDAKDRKIQVRFTVESGSETLKEWKEELTVPAGGTLEKQVPPLSLKFPANQTGRLVIDAKDDQGGLIYHSQIQTTAMTPDFYRRICDKPNGTWVFDNPARTAWNLTLDYNPYFKNAGIAVDATAVYLPDELKNATSAQISLRNSADGKIIREEKVPLAKLKAETVWRDLDLQEGSYRLTGQLFDSAGKALCAPVTDTYSRKVFPWEHNTLGAAKTVYAPFVPMKWDEKAGQLKLWGRTYKPGPFGLLAGIETTKEVAFSSKTDPVTLEVEWEDGRRETAAGDWSVVKSEPGEFIFKGNGTCGPLRISGQSTVDVDGFCATSLQVTPSAPTAIRRMELIIPLPPEADTNWFYRGRAEAHGGAVSRSPGILWSNIKSAKGKPPENVFTPVLALGSGDFSLWWFADGDESWILDYQKPSQEVVRENGKLFLRVSVINKPTVLENPISTTFALGTSPYYPDEKDRRVLQWGGSLRVHDTSGYGYWGTGVDSIDSGKGDYPARLKAAIDERKKSKRETQLDKVSWLGPREEVSARLNSPVVLYNSGELLGPAMEEYDTYAGEWMGDSCPEFMPEYRDSDIHAQVKVGDGLVQDWRSQPRALGPALADLTQSVVDCRIWHYKQNMEKLGINGYWFDNAAIWPGKNVLTNRAYRTEDGTIRGRYPVFARRELNRRLFNIYKEAGKDPFTLVGGSTAPQFTQWMWAIEGDWYVYSPKTRTMLDNLARSQEYDIDSRPEEIVNAPTNPLAAFRAQATMRRIKGSIVCNLKENDPTHERASRNVIGLALLHDFGVESKVYKPPLDKIRKILLDFGAFGDDSTVFTPYWRKPPSPLVVGEGLPVSTYLNTTTGALLAVVLNIETKELTTTPGPEAGKWAWSNAETGKPMASPVISVPSHDFRVLLAKPKANP